MTIISADFALVHGEGPWRPWMDTFASAESSRELIFYDILPISTPQLVVKGVGGTANYKTGDLVHVARTQGTMYLEYICEIYV